MTTVTPGSAPATPAPTSPAPPESPGSDAQVPPAVDDQNHPAGVNPDDQEHPAGAEPDDQDDDGGSNREKRYRLKLRETERERDQLADTLARTRAAIVDSAVNAAGVDPRLLAAAGHTLDTMVGEDGLIDREKLADAITETAREFRVPPKGRPPHPNHQQGHASGHPGTKSSWSGAIKGSAT
ncbi:hypothetical protein [Mycolicibacterium alvei]|uniref:hypothetical protein n=1 Tax=Mycolicibacterium alvei TaxID=67081 RepID=UPI0021F33130|nr:hypothetical protein [Mycolicibacterium alvei]MCV7000709.1 hypothetical protein [Mycolicibacterium alvei]